MRDGVSSAESLPIPRRSCGAAAGKRHLCCPACISLGAPLQLGDGAAFRGCARLVSCFWDPWACGGGYSDGRRISKVDRHRW